MPEIVKQTKRSINPKDVENPIDRIQPVRGFDSEGIKVSIYGRPKTGKTRLISSFPKPVLIIGTEDGTRSIIGVEQVYFVQIFRTKEIRPLVEHATRKGYKTISIDTATQLQKMVLSEMLGLDEIPIQHQRGVLKNIDNQEYSHLTKSALNELMSFNGNIVYTAHERNHNEETSSHLITPTFGSDLSKAVANWLNGACDYVCQTFIREQIEDVGNGVKLESGKGEYCLRIGAHPVFMTGFRVPIGSVLPNVIVNPTYSKMLTVITGKAKGEELR